LRVSRGLEGGLEGGLQVKKASRSLRMASRGFNGA